MNAILRVVAWLIAIMLVALPVAAVVNGWVAGDRWPLRKLRVTGQFERVDPQQLRATVMPYAKDGFFAVRLEDAQSAIAKLPWVERAEVRKRWPDILEIRIVEHVPFARWGSDKLLSEHGRLFPVKSVRGAALPNDLPQLDGDPARVADVVALYNESRELLSPGGVDVRGLELDERGSWSLTLASGTEVVIGRSDAKARLTRFSRLLPRLLAQRQRPLVRADLRYTNGFALSWTNTANELPPLRRQGVRKAACKPPACGLTNAIELRSMAGRVGKTLRGLPQSDSAPSQPPPAVAGGGAKQQAST